MKPLVHAIPHQSALWAASFPPGEAKGACTNSPWYTLTGILRTAPDPSGAMRHLPFQGRPMHAYAFWAAFLSAIQAEGFTNAAAAWAAYDA